MAPLTPGTGPPPRHRRTTPGWAVGCHVRSLQSAPPHPASDPHTFGGRRRKGTLLASRCRTGRTSALSTQPLRSNPDPGLLLSTQDEDLNQILHVGEGRDGRVLSPRQRGLESGESTGDRGLHRPLVPSENRNTPLVAKQDLGPRNSPRASLAATVDGVPLDTSGTYFTCSVKGSRSLTLAL